MVRFFKADGKWITTSKLNKRVYRIISVDCHLKQVEIDRFYSDMRYAFKRIGMVAKRIKADYKFSVPQSNTYGFHYSKENGLSIYLS